MSIVTLPLPSQIANGQVIDAVPVMADLNYLATQINANAQPLGAASALEWQPLGQTPTFISTTSFSVPGNLTATLPIGRRLQTTNTAGTIYSTITASVFTSLTTITVVNDSGVLDSGLSAVNYGILSSTNPSLPQFTALEAFIVTTSANLTTNTQYTLGVSPQWTTNTVYGDQYSEYSAGSFTAKYKGFYFIQCVCQLLRNGATISNTGFLDTFVNGANTHGGTTVTPFIYDQSALQYGFCTLSEMLALNASDVLTIRTAVNIQWSASGPVQAQGAHICIVRVR
jgi:hypothetical protein